MKKIMTISIILLFSVMTYAQIPNSSFENWNGGLPNGWGLTGFGISQANTAHAGANAVKISVINYLGSGLILDGSIITGDAAAYSYNYHETARPAALHGWYILNSVGGDIGNIEIIFQGNGGLPGTGGLELTKATNVYKEFVVNIGYLYTTQSDSAKILISTANTINPSSSDSSHVGTYLIIDDLSYGVATGVQDLSQEKNILEDASPNPSKDQMNIVYSLSEKSNVTLAVYDIFGKEMSMLVNEPQTSGRYKVILDVNTFPSGTYFYKLNVEGQTISKKLVVLK